MKVEHIVQVGIITYYDTVVEDNTDHPMTDDQIGEIARGRALNDFDKLTIHDPFQAIWEDDVMEPHVLQTINADPESPDYLEDITDDFIDIQRKLKKGA